MKKWQCKICGHIHQRKFPPEKCPVCGADSTYFVEIEQEQESPIETLRRIIIIGNGAAGIEAARTIREHHSDCEIIIFSKEPYHFYSRIHLSSFISGNQIPEKLFIYPDAWYQENNIQIRLNTPIEEILPDKHQVRDAHGNTHIYDRLIITAGAASFVPKIKGINKKQVFTLRNIGDGFKILDCIPKCKTATVIGGGILGIEAAASLNTQGLDVTIVERSDHIMSRQLDQNGAEVLQILLEKRGISFHLFSNISKISGQKTANSILLDSGENIPTNMVLICTGIRANTALAKKAGIRVNKGIVVDEQLKTNDKDIFAAGDVVEFDDKIFGIWPAAVEQGQAAAKNALGIKTIYRGTLPLHILKVAGIELTSLGLKYLENKNLKEIIHKDIKMGQYTRLIHDNNILLGCVVLGLSGVSFRLEKLIKKKLSIQELLPSFERGDWEVLKKMKIK